MNAFLKNLALFLLGALFALISSLTAQPGQASHRFGAPDVAEPQT